LQPFLIRFAPVDQIRTAMLRTLLQQRVSRQWLRFQLPLVARYHRPSLSVPDGDGRRFGSRCALQRSRFRFQMARALRTQSIVAQDRPVAIGYRAKTSVSLLAFNFDVIVAIIPAAARTPRGGSGGGRRWLLGGHVQGDRSPLRACRFHTLYQ